MPIFADYRIPKELVSRPAKPAERGVSWEQIFQHWELVVLDLQQYFGADWDDPTMQRAWPWWRSRILGTLTAGGRVSRALGVFSD